MAFYLFPGVIYRRYKEGMNVFSNLVGVAKSSISDVIDPALQGIYEVYELTTRQYLGFGTLLQFIPGTNANLARKQLSNQLEFAIRSFQSDYSNIAPTIPRYPRLSGEDGITRPTPYREFYWFKKHSLLLPLSTFLNFGPVFEAVEDIAEGFKSKNIRISFKIPLIKLVFMLPFLNDLFFVNDGLQITVRQDALKTILHSILNPVRIIDDALNFLHEAACRLIDIGSERDYSSKPRAVFKGIVGIFFGMIKIPVKTLKHIVDLPLNAAKLLFISPIAHFASSTRSAYQNWGKEVLIATKKEIQDVKELRQVAKAQVPSFSTMTKKRDTNRKYIGISKDDVFSERGTKPEQLIAIRASKEKIAETSALLATVRFFDAKQQKAKDVPAAIEQARTVLPLI